MRKTINTIMIVLLVFTGMCMAKNGAENPGAYSTVPPSTLKNELISNPASAVSYNNSNLLITGNVTSNKYFRGVIPYRDSSQFQGTLGSTSLDSFLRRSAPTQSSYRFNRRYQPFYSPSATVTSLGTTPQGNPVVYRAPSQSGSPLTVPGQFALEPLPNARTDFYGRGTVFKPMPTRPLAGDLTDTAKTIARQKGIYDKDLDLYSDIPYPETYEEITRAKEEQTDQQQLQKDIETLSQQAEMLGKSLADQTKSPNFDQLPELKSEQLEEDDGKFKPDTLNELQKQDDEELEIKKQFDPKDSRALEFLKAAQERKAAAEAQQEAAETGSDKNEDQKRYRLPEPEGLALPEGFGREKFDEYNRAGAEYLTEGKFYRAADAYTLALIYNPESHIANAGKSHSLFAAGEYMSSALYLSRTLILRPEYLEEQIDLFALLGDRDKVEARILDLNAWQANADSQELKFLLSYVLYRLNRLDPAKRLIEPAYNAMDGAPAVKTLKDAIYKKSEEMEATIN